MAYYPQRFVEVIRHGVVVNFADPALLRANTGGKIAEVVDSQRHVSRHRFPDRLAVIPGFRRRQQLQILLHPVGDFEQDRRPVLHGGVSPFLFRFVGRIQRQVDITLTGAGNLAQRLAGNRGQVGIVFAVDGRDPVAANKVVITGLQLEGKTILAGLDTR